MPGKRYNGLSMGGINLDRIGHTTANGGGAERKHIKDIPFDDDLAFIKAVHEEGRRREITGRTRYLDDDEYFVFFTSRLREEPLPEQVQRAKQYYDKKLGALRKTMRTPTISTLYHLLQESFMNHDNHNRQSQNAYEQHSTVKAQSEQPESETDANE